jgi:uncharacterized membrane protein YphA (DoxX/SURF4 family)
MATSASITIRLAFAYLLIVNSVDMISSGPLPSDSLHVADNGLYKLIWLAAIVNIVGGILLAAGWRLKTVALTVAASTTLFAIIYQEPVAAMIVVGLLMMAWRASGTRFPGADNKSVRTYRNPARSNRPNTDGFCS